jgi:catechol 2,3-dioxygenase-like lactoylglutathione lyase family enzyme
MLMKRFHVHIAVADLEQSIRFYSTFFDVPPSVAKEDYAKWMLDDPRINFAISTRGREPGLDHLGIQVDDGDALKMISTRLKAAEQPILEQEQTTCCYARGDKAWVHDPQGIAWESFYTAGSATTYGEDANFETKTDSACCAPMPEVIPISINFGNRESRK